MFYEFHKRTFPLSIVGVFLLFLSTPAMAVEVELIGGFEGSAASRYDYFGRSVAIDQDRFIVGAHSGEITSDDEDYNCGLAYIFENVAGEWQQESLLYPHDYHDPGLLFGYSVDIDGDFAVVTTTSDYNSSTGTVYVFFRSLDGWSETQALKASDSAPNWSFGRSVSLDDDLLVVGTFPQTDPGSQGKAYVFERAGSEYGETQILTASDGMPDDKFGYAVKASEDWIFVGAISAENESGGLGAVYVFAHDENGWYEYQKLIRSDNESYWNGGFGWSLDFDGTSLIIGDKGAKNALGQRTGGAYVFTLIDGYWSVQQKLIPEGILVDGSLAGDSVGIEDDIAIIGDYTINYEGEAFVFSRSGGEWIEQVTLLSPDPSDRQFGYSLSIDNGQVVIGAPWDSDFPNYGSAYLFGVKAAKTVDCIGFDAPLDNYPVTIKGRRPALPLRATLEFEDETPVTDTSITKPPIVVVYPDPAEDDEAMDITGDVTPSITPDVGNEFLFTTGGVWQFILGLENYSSSGTYTVRMESGDPGDYEFDQECITEFIVP